MAATIVDLLYDDAAGAKDVVDNFTPALNKGSYIELLDHIARGDRMKPPIEDTLIILIGGLDYYITIMICLSP